jgi:hypothetical protein
MLTTHTIENLYLIGLILVKVKNSNNIFSVYLLNFTRYDTVIYMPGTQFSINIPCIRNHIYTHTIHKTIH